MLELLLLFPLLILYQVSYSSYEGMIKFICCILPLDYLRWLKFLLSSFFFLIDSFSFSTVISALQIGHLCISSSIFDLNQLSMHSEWNKWLHIGIFFIETPFWYSSKHITHSYYLNSSILISYRFSLIKFISSVILYSTCYYEALAWS